MTILNVRVVVNFQYILTIMKENAKWYDTICVTVSIAFIHFYPFIINCILHIIDYIIVIYYATNEYDSANIVFYDFCLTVTCIAPVQVILRIKKLCLKPLYRMTLYIVALYIMALYIIILCVIIIRFWLYDGERWMKKRLREQILNKNAGVTETISEKVISDIKSVSCK